ncbi:MAG TPA: hypothetical protein VJG90_06425 [Candidatus Nanoarchaeia archaeon]|nr:hypothetical protein [Candidatus Nanoarchaeia archaeon]
MLRNISFWHASSFAAEHSKSTFLVPKLRRFAIRKNIMDLDYNKNLQYLNTVVVVSFTYCIGLALALLTKQVQLTDMKQLTLIASVTIMVLGSTIALFVKFRSHMNEILRDIERL